MPSSRPRGSTRRVAARSKTSDGGDSDRHGCYWGPVGVAVFSNLARPGGNVTGFASQNLQLEEKRFEMLHELVPGMARIVMLGNTGNAYVDLAMKHIETLGEYDGRS